MTTGHKHDDEMHTTPCEYTKNLNTSMRWVIGIMITVFGAALMFSIRYLKEVTTDMSEKAVAATERANEAVDIAIEAKDKTAKIEVMDEKLKNIQSDVNELKDIKRVVDQMGRDQAKITATLDAMNSKLQDLRKSDAED